MGLFRGFKSILTPEQKQSANIRVSIPQEKNRKKEKEEFDIKPLEYYEILNREVKPLEDIMIGFSSALPTIKNVDDRIEVLNSLIYSYYDLRSKCMSLGPDYQEYFSKMWEHLHNSKNKDFCFVEKYEEELERLNEERDVLFAEQKLHEKKANGLKEHVFSVLEENKEILQTDIYKMFDPVVQKDIQSILYFMAKDGIVEREKVKSTYMIKLRKGNEK